MGIIEAEAQRRLADLRAKGAIPGDKDWREAPPPRPASETPVKGRGSLLWRRASSVTAVVSNMQKKLEKDSEGDSESDTPTRSRSSSLGGRGQEASKLPALGGYYSSRTDDSDASRDSSPSS